MNCFTGVGGKLQEYCMHTTYTSQSSIGNLTDFERSGLELSGLAHTTTDSMTAQLIDPKVQTQS